MTNVLTPVSSAAQHEGATVDVAALGELLLGTWAHARLAARELAGQCRNSTRLRGRSRRSTASAFSASSAARREKWQVLRAFPSALGGKTTTAATSPDSRSSSRRPEPADQVRRAVGALRRRDPAPRHRVPPGLPARGDEPRRAWRLRHDRDRPRLRCRDVATTATYDEATRGVRHQHPVPRRLEGIPRQRRRARNCRNGLRPADHQGRQPRRPRALRADPRSRTGLPARHRRRG